MSRSYRFGPFLLDRPAYRLLYEDQPRVLTPKLLDLLFHLVERAGDLVTKEALLDAVWPDANVTDNALSQAVSELRQSLGDEPSNPTFIKTVARRGYRFIAPVVEIDTAPSITAAAAQASREPRVWPGPSESPAIAVLDFANVTSDPDTAWLAAGIAETVTGDLRALGSFRIVDRRRVLEATAGGDLSMQAVAEATGATFVVVGSFQRAGSRMRITARLVDATRGEAMADAKVDGPVEQIFELQDQVVVEFARELGLSVQRSGGSRVGARETSSLEAYRAFTSGWLRLETLDVREMPAAIDDFRQAIAADHRYALAHTGLASAQFASYESTRSDNAPARELLDDAIDHARHAVALDDDLAEAHAALGFLLTSRWAADEALASTRRAVALEPGNWRHHFRLGHAAWGDERLRAADATLLHHPGFAFAHFQAAMVHVARGDLARAERVLLDGAALQDRQKTKRERFPALGLHWLLGCVRLAGGAVDVAIADFECEIALADPVRLYGREFAMHAHLGLGCAHARAGRHGEARQAYAAALEAYPDHAQTHLAAARSCGALGHAAEQTRHRAAALAACDTLGRTRPVEAGLVRAYQFAADERVDAAVAELGTMLTAAPRGFAGWTLPVEPLLDGVRAQGAFGPVQHALAQRAG